MTVVEAQDARLAKARALVEAGAYLVTAGSVYVYSDAPGVAGYTVSQERCDCPDATLGMASRLSILCKHACVAAAVLAARNIIARSPDIARAIAEAA